MKDFAQRWQREHVIPHCPECAKPCCNLDELVLDLDKRELRELYGIGPKKLPAHIKTQDGRYYAHGKPCPAYVDTKCTHYATRPEGCRDFPIYVDGDAMTVDLRCEAMNADAVERALRASFDRVERAASDFDELVVFEISRSPSGDAR
jgi:Fe-S-cluster containining protein